MPELFLISGDDDFALKARARALAAELCGGAPEGTEALEVVDGTGEGTKLEPPVGNFLDALRTPPFLTEHKVLWLRHCRFLTELADAAQEKKKTPLKECADFLLQAFPAGLTVLIDGPGVDLRKTYWKNLKARGAVLEVLNAPKSSDKNFAGDRRMSITDWARSSGKKIDADAAAWLTEIIGGDSGTLMNELEKIACYTGDAPQITLADCRAVCSGTPEAITWAFTGALTERNAPEALRLLGLLLEQGEAELRIFAALSGEFQRMIQVRLSMAELGLSRVSPRTFDEIPADAKERFPENVLLGIHPYRAFKMCEGAGRWSEPSLAEALNKILAANRALVSGGGDSRWVMEQLVFDLAGGSSQRR